VRAVYAFMESLKHVPLALPAPVVVPVLPGINTIHATATVESSREFVSS
jgi:hypothetical protein